MDYLQLNNGVEMPLLGFGTFLLNDDGCEKAVAEALLAGYTMIDTAQAYHNEVAIRKGIKKSGIAREKIFLVTKVDFKSYEKTQEAIEQSMKNLQTDYLDLLLLHWPFANYYAAWRVMENLYAKGQVRAIGISNFAPSQMLDLIAYNNITPVVNQIETNLYCQRLSERQWLAKKGVIPMAYAPLGQGNRNDMFIEPLVSDLSQKYAKTPAQIMLRFLTQQGIAVIPKSSHSERIRENSQIFDFHLTVQEIDSLIALDKNIALIGNLQMAELVEQSLTW